jgi:hypothetical protein
VTPQKESGGAKTDSLWLHARVSPLKARLKDISLSRDLVQFKEFIDHLQLLPAKLFREWYVQGHEDMLTDEHWFEDKNNLMLLMFRYFQLAQENVTAAAAGSWHKVPGQFSQRATAHSAPYIESLLMCVLV